MDPVEAAWDLDDLAKNREILFSSLRPETHGFSPSSALEILRDIL